ncbi:MAG TPA: hypothetical protein VIL00_10990 [Pseudonocardiaceae bacterium]
MADKVAERIADQVAVRVADILGERLALAAATLRPGAEVRA